jgi:hypothetical protein
MAAVAIIYTVCTLLTVWLVALNPFLRGVIVTVVGLILEKHFGPGLGFPSALDTESALRDVQDPEWLEQALHNKYPGVKVASIKAQRMG